MFIGLENGDSSLKCDFPVIYLYIYVEQMDSEI